jgi:hypothetical protein
MDDENKRNNLFDFATSELSQDAFICWLIEWINHEKEDQNLYKTAKLLLDKFFDLCGNSKPKVYRKVKVKKQFENIDVLVVVNDEYVIIIEDKTDTENHSGQLNRYENAVLNSKDKDLPDKLSEDNLLLIYFKTGNQSNLSDVISKDYKPFMRGDFLKILKDHSGKINNAIFKDYYDYLQNIDYKTKNYEETNIEEWKWCEWQGFYIELQDKLDFQKDKKGEVWEGQWKYVANQTGGFIGFGWNWFKIKGGGIYMQLEQEKFCFKVMADETILMRSEFRKKWHDKIMQTCEGKNLNVCKPKRFGNGKFMTVAVLNGDYRCTKDNKFNIEKTIKQLKEMENILKETVNKNS